MWARQKPFVRTPVIHSEAHERHGESSEEDGPDLDEGDAPEEKRASDEIRPAEGVQRVYLLVKECRGLGC
jgi:hypothetical protein